MIMREVEFIRCYFGPNPSGGSILVPEPVAVTWRITRQVARGVSIEEQSSFASRHSVPMDVFVTGFILSCDPLWPLLSKVSGTPVTDWINDIFAQPNTSVIRFEFRGWDLKLYRATFSGVLLGVHYESERFSSETIRQIAEKRFKKNPSVQAFPFTVYMVGNGAVADNLEILQVPG
jgi:hypothetical protein